MNQCCHQRGQGGSDGGVGHARGGPRNVLRASYFRGKEITGSDSGAGQETVKFFFGSLEGGGVTWRVWQL